jgi:hypothetical protein
MYFRVGNIHDETVWATDALRADLLVIPAQDCNSQSRPNDVAGPEEMIGQPIGRIIPEDRLEDELQILARLGRGERVDHYETVRRRSDGHFIDVSLCVSPV